MKNKRIKQSGFGSYEFLTMTMICLILSMIILNIALRVQKDERYTVFAYNAKVLGTNAIHYQMLEENDVIYLKQLIQLGMISAIKNPFQGAEYCDIFESKVTFTEEGKRVSLKCGPFLIQNQLLGEKEIQIYQVTDWKGQRENASQVERTLYNYKGKGNQYLFETFLEEELFLQLLNEKNKTSYQTIEEIPLEYKVKKKTFYRSEKLIKKIDY